MNETLQELLTADEKLTVLYEEISAVQEQNEALHQTIAILNERVEQLVSEKAAEVLSADKKLIEQYVELARAERKVRHGAEIQLVLREIAEAAVLAPSMDELYATVHRLVGKVLPAKLFHINLLDETAGEIFMPYHANDLNFIPTRRPIGKGMSEYIMRLGRTANLTPTDMDRLRETGEYAIGKVQTVQVRHYLGAPLINQQGKPFGVMSIFLMGDTQAFQPEDVEAFSIIAAQVSMAIERKRGQEEIRDAKEHFELIFNTGPDGALITRLNDGLIINISEGFTALTGWAREECAEKPGIELDIWKNIEERKRMLDILEQKGSCVNFEATFLKKDGTEIIGLVSAKTTTIKERPHMISVIRDITERKRMERELRIHATTDGLTGIFNRRYFLSRADEELHRAARYGGTSTLLMLDIDHFKKVNDTFGHAVGDAAIQRIAKLCSEALRSTDLVGRMGGEEFSMLLQETGLLEAEQVAERLRRRVQEDNFGDEQNIQCPLRVSVGVAERQSNDETIAALMMRADEALYRAKREGRNKVVTA